VASFVETHGHAVDEGDFEALYTTYKSDVQRLASYLLKNASDAEDAAQTVFLNVLRALRQGVTPSDPRAWLLAITRNVCFSRHRAAAARPVQVELALDEPAGPNGEETPSADEIVGALARLLPNQRTALILRDFRGVSRAEISDLMSLSPVAVEALLTRARTAFREELEAGEQQFECAETRALVEEQLDGLITVADRHSLRSHLRHCAPCSTLARAVRSSRTKVAGILFWPLDLISRLVAAFTQAPAIVHVAAVVTSTAAVATIAIPAAVSNSPALGHVEGRTAPGPVAAAVVAARPGPTAPAPVSTHAAKALPLATWHPAAKAPSHAPARTHIRVHTTRPHSAPTATRATVHKAPAAPSATAASPHGGPRVRTSPATSSAGSVHTPSQTTSPTSGASSPSSSGSGVTMPGATAPRSSSPAVKPAAKPKAPPKPKSKPKPKGRKGGKRGGKAPRAPAPPPQTPSSTPPAQDLQPPDSGAVDSGSGAVIGGGKPTAGAPASDSSSTGSGTSTSSSSDSAGSDDGKDKDKNKHKHK
jgi:RNA polymerase sigma factor (sigma-70 family)